MLKKWYQQFICPDWEKAKLLKLAQKFVSPNAQVLDIGCGYGRYYFPLEKLGYQVLGVEQNLAIVEENQRKGMKCLSVDGFQENTTQFDAIICAHIIEHFTPDALFSFLDFYLSKLKKGGHLIIATPLYSDYFYDDFDHIKPYHAEGIEMVFGGKQAQVKYYSEHTIVLQDIWFRKSPRLSTFHRAKYFKSCKTRFLQAYDFLMSLLYRLSMGYLGRKDGWIGVFQKQ